jgi:hypothetical protein
MPCRNLTDVRLSNPIILKCKNFSTNSVMQQICIVGEVSAPGSSRYISLCNQVTSFVLSGICYSENFMSELHCSRFRGYLLCLQVERYLCYFTSEARVLLPIPARFDAEFSWLQ